MDPPTPTEAVRRTGPAVRVALVVVVALVVALVVVGFRARPESTPEAATDAEEVAGPSPSAPADPEVLEPTGRPPWTVVHIDEFSQSTLDPRWSPYTGSPSSDPHTTGTEERVRMAAGALVLDAIPVDPPSRCGSRCRPRPRRATVPSRRARPTRSPRRPASRSIA